MSAIHVIHENDEWTAPLLCELAALGAPYRDWHLASGRVDLGSRPPEGIFYSRMSASAHTRGHRFAPEHAGCVLAWLEGHGARVINGTRALGLELSKVAQYAALESMGIRVPRTVAAVGIEEVARAGALFDGPFITKHNRAGKGLGVKLFHTHRELEAHLGSGDFEPSVDGVTLVQEYVRSPESTITRVEFIGQRFLYAVRVDTSAGFELCPADACNVDASLCPTEDTRGAKFAVIDDFDHPLLEPYRRFLVAHDVEVAAFEFVADERGRAYTYDINTNTNYNAAAERRLGLSGLGTLARFLSAELGRRRTERARAWRIA